MPRATNSILEVRATQRFEREKACYDQNCQQFRSLNQLMWQIPIIAMTLTGGLWFGISKLNDPRIVGAAMLAFASAADLGLIAVLWRIRFVIGAYLSAIRSFYAPGFVSAGGTWLYKPRTVITVFSVLLGLAAVLSLIGAFLVGSGEIMSSKTSAESESNIRCVIRSYDKDAEKYISQYESVSFEQVHGDILDLLPDQPVRVLDVGAGSGRDAAALANRGFNVTAVEPSSVFRTTGRQLHPDPKIKWVDDCLPNLGSLTAYELKFDVVLLSAVWMNIQPSDRYESFNTLASILNPEGLLILTLRHGQTDPERHMYEVSVIEVETLAKRFGLEIVRNVATRDVLGRDLSWTTLVLRKQRG